MPQLSVTVVPDSGTGQLAGLAGEMQLDQSGGRHVGVYPCWSRTGLSKATSNKS
ncbi:DUF3224 domain-containing protein [Deinococcus sp.]|uniref:DUF3224 domain-containing protein n=1 Tax=Deinococcus sp. TaxID=47478 RepID=UPI0038D4EF55